MPLHLSMEEGYTGRAEIEVIGYEDVNLRLKSVPCRIVYHSLLDIDPKTAIERRRRG